MLLPSNIALPPSLRSTSSLFIIPFSNFTFTIISPAQTQFTSIGHLLSDTTSSGVIKIPPLKILSLRNATVFSCGIAGHSANSQLGPVRPTAEPSGQILASSVQAIGLVPPFSTLNNLVLKTSSAPTPTTTNIKTTYNFFISLLYHSKPYLNRYIYINPIIEIFFITNLFFKRQKISGRMSVRENGGRPFTFLYFRFCINCAPASPLSSLLHFFYFL